MKKITPTLATGIVGMLFILPMLGHVFGLQGNIDNRRMNNFPTFDQRPKDWFKNLDGYLGDNFGFRAPILRFNRTIRDMIGENPDKVAKGQDGWLFTTGNGYRDEFEGIGDWTDNRVEAWIDDLAALKNLAEAREVPFTAVIALDKIQAYPEKAPKNWAGPSKRRFRTALYDHPDAGAVGLVDIEDAFLAQKQQGIISYSSRDTHWNVNGSYIAYEAIMKSLDPARHRHKFEGEYLEYNSKMLGDLERVAGYAKTRGKPYMGVSMPKRPRFVAKDLPKLTEGAKALRFGQPTKLYSDDAPAPKGAIIVVGDSFFNLLRFFLLDSYEEVVLIHRRDGRVPLAEVAAHMDARDTRALLVINSERHAHTMDGIIDISVNKNSISND